MSNVSQEVNKLWKIAQIQSTCMRVGPFNLDNILFPLKHLICLSFALCIVSIIKLSNESNVFEVMSMQGLFTRGEILEILKSFIESGCYLERKSTRTFILQYTIKPPFPFLIFMLIFKFSINSLGLLNVLLFQGRPSTECKDISENNAKCT